MFRPIWLPPALSVTPPLSPIALPLIEYPPPLKASAPKTIPDARSFTFVKCDAPDGKYKTSPATGTPPIQLPASDHALLDAPGHVFGTTVLVRVTSLPSPPA